MLFNVLMVAPELVEKKHYFLETLDNPIAIWVIRGVCLVVGVVALVLYYRMKRKRGE